LRWLLGLVLLACLTGCGDEEATGGWHRGADSPLAPRWGTVVGWTGTEVVVAGGLTTVPHPPSAEVSESAAEEYAADGAAYDPDQDSWRTIPDAPIPLRYYYRAAMAGDTLVVFATPDKGDGLGHRWYAYDASDDAWRVLPDPPHRARDPGSLSTWQDEVYALDHANRVMVLDLSTDTWSVLPASPETPAIRGWSSVVGTDLGPVVTGRVSRTEQRAEIFEGQQWRRFEDPIPGAPWWHWTGERLVVPDPQVGGQGEPSGGTLDVHTGEFAELANAPDTGSATGSLGNSADGPLMASFGYLYDDRDGSWTPIPPLRDTLTQASGVIAGDRLVVFGGFDSAAGYDDPEGLSNAVHTLDLPAH